MGMSAFDGGEYQSQKIIDQKKTSYWNGWIF